MMQQHNELDILEEACSAAISVLFFAAGWIAANMGGAWLHLVRSLCRLCVYSDTLLLNKTRASGSERQKSLED